MKLPEICFAVAHKQRMGRQKNEWTEIWLRKEQTIGITWKTMDKTMIINYQYFEPR